MSATKMSKRGLARLSLEEGLVTHPYNDSEGYASIGVGHLLHLSPVTAADLRAYAGFTRADAIELLHKDIASFEAEMRKLLKRPAAPHEFDAMMSLMFNIGGGGFAGSTVLREFNQGHKQKAADAFLMWRNPAVLLPRRKRERELFLTPYPRHR